MRSFGDLTVTKLSEYLLLLIYNFHRCNSTFIKKLENCNALWKRFMEAFDDFLVIKKGNKNSFQVYRLDHFLLSKKISFPSLQKLYSKELEYYLPDKYFRFVLWQTPNYFFHQDTFQWLLMYFQIESVNSRKSRPKYNFSSSSSKNKFFHNVTWENFTYLESCDSFIWYFLKKLTEFYLKKLN